MRYKICTVLLINLCCGVFLNGAAAVGDELPSLDQFAEKFTAKEPSLESVVAKHFGYGWRSPQAWITGVTCATTVGRFAMLLSGNNDTKLRFFAAGAAIGGLGYSYYQSQALKNEVANAFVRVSPYACSVTARDGHDLSAVSGINFLVAIMNLGIDAQRAHCVQDSVDAYANRNKNKATLGGYEKSLVSCLFIKNGRQWINSNKTLLNHFANNREHDFNTMLNRANAEAFEQGVSDSKYGLWSLPKGDDPSRNHRIRGINLLHYVCNAFTVVEQSAAAAE